MNKLFSHSLIGAAVLGFSGLACAAIQPLSKQGTKPLDKGTVQALRESRAAGPRPKVAPAPVLPAMSAEAVAERNAQARGGAGAWTKVNTMMMSGKLDAGRERKDGRTAGGLTSTPRQAKLDKRAEILAAVKAGVPPEGKLIQLPFKMEMQRPAKIRLEVAVKGDTAVQVYDGTTGWKLRPFLGRREVEPYTPEELKVAAGQQELDGPLMNYRSKGIKVESDGTETVDKRDCYRLKVTLRNGEQRRVWIDSKTFLEARTEDQPRHFNGKDRMTYTVFRDYRPVQGLMVAHQLETQVEGVPQTNKIYIEQVALNPALDSTQFSKPQ